MEQAQFIRNRFFQDIGKSRIKRILVCTLGIAGVWLFADTLSGSLSVNLWHDALCLLFGIVLERIIPWGKQNKQ